MKKEYEESLKKMEWFFDNYQNISEKELHTKCIEYFDKFIDELTKTKEQKILEYLISFFESKFDYTFEGILEHLKSEISSNYTLEQILQAFYKKFDTLVKNDIEIAVEMSMWFFDSGMFDDFRKMFNAVKTDKSRIFLDEFLDWYPDLEDKVNILRKDMEAWSKK